MTTTILLATLLIFLILTIFIERNRKRRDRQIKALKIAKELAERRVLKSYIAEAQELRAKVVRANKLADEVHDREFAMHEKLTLWQTQMQTILKRFEGYGYRNKKGPLERGEGWKKLQELAGCKSTR